MTIAYPYYGYYGDSLNEPQTVWIATIQPDLLRGNTLLLGVFASLQSAKTRCGDDLDWLYDDKKGVYYSKRLLGDLYVVAPYPLVA